jgi:hypothetical protein
MSNTPTYLSWQAMLNRCRNPAADQYPKYGAVGIIVCERWCNSFENFLIDMGLRPSRQHTIDRFPDKNGNYEPYNCRWATWREQQNNRNNNVIVEYHGQQMTLAQAIRCGPVRKSTVMSRIHVLGWDIQRAIDAPAILGANQWSY